MTDEHLAVIYDFLVYSDTKLRLKEPIRAALAEINGLRDRPEWKSIETAPKDGTTIYTWLVGSLAKVAFLDDSYGHVPGWYVLLRSPLDWVACHPPPSYWISITAPPGASRDTDAAAQGESE